MEEIEEVGQLVGKKLIIGGYIYVRSKPSKNNQFYWDCQLVRRKECKARAITLQTVSELIVLKGPKKSPHEHPPNQDTAKAELVKVNLKRVAEDHPECPPAQILRDNLSTLKPGVLAKLPERENLKKSLRRERRRALPPNPKSLEEIDELPQRYQKTLANDRFLFYDSRDDENFGEGRVFAFTTRNNLERLANSDSWFLDGTFKVSPSIFTQIFTVIGKVIKPSNQGEEPTVIAFPFVFALLSSKETKQYEAVLRAIDSAALSTGIHGCRPQRIVSDFEIPIINACRLVYSETTIRCCFFHLGQAMYRKIQNEGLQINYNDPNDDTIRKQTHMILSLAFVPPSDVIDAFEELSDEVSDDLLEVLDYFDRTYVRGRRGQGRRRAVPPRYPPDLWNQYEATLQGLHRTNNVSEGWHNRFRLMVNKNHPDLYAFLTQIQKEQQDTETSLTELSLGRKVRATPRQTWISLQKRLRTITEEYQRYKEENKILEYLTNLAYNIQIS